MITLTLTPDSTDFPDTFRNLPQAPQRLFVTENFTNLLTRPRVAIVGSRKVTNYGREVTRTLAKQLAEQNIVIVSGLAFGVDSVAHTGCLEANGQTIAVLPGALERIYPASHHGLAKRISKQGGALISEYPEGSNVMKHMFIERNRLIASLADVVLVTEAGINSGSLHTANFALEQGIPVFAVPGNITSLISAGTNNLIKNGATPVTSVDDILNSLGLDAQNKINPTSENPVEQTILNLLLEGVRDGVQLYQKSSVDITQFNRSLTMLEITGKVKAMGSNQWSL